MYRSTVMISIDFINFLAKFNQDLYEISRGF